MHSAIFMTHSATDHVIRALDELSRAGFTLEALRVSGPAGRQEVRVDFSGLATVTAETYAARLSRLPGVDCLRLELTAAVHPPARDQHPAACRPVREASSLPCDLMA